MKFPSQARLAALLFAGILAVPPVAHAILSPGPHDRPDFESRTEPLSDPRLRSALDLLNSGKIAESVIEAKAYVRQYPDSAPAREILGAAMALNGDVEQGLAELKRAVALEPSRSSAITKIGDVLLAMKQTKEAQQQFLAALKITPTDRRAHQRLGLIYAREGRPDLAIGHFEQGLLGTPPEYIGIKIDLARLYNASGKAQKTLDLLSPLVKIGAQDASLQLELGSAYRALGKPEQAIAFFQTVVSLEPAASRGLIALGTAYREAGRSEESVNALQKAVQLDPKSDIAQLQLGETYFSLRQYDRAMASFQAAQELNPKRLLARKRFADSLVAQNRFADAIPIYTDLLKRPGVDRPDLYDALGTAYQLNSDLPQAEKTLKLLVQKYPKHPTAYLRLGMYYGFVRKYDKALEKFRQGLEFAKDQRPLLRAISVAQHQSGNFGASLKTAETLVRQPTSGIDEKAYLASLYLDDKRTTDAIRLYKEVVQSKADHVMAHNNLAMLYSDAGQHGDALRHAERAIELAPAVPTVQDTLGWVLVRGGQPQKAMEPLKKATGASPVNPVFQYHLAAAHSGIGQRAEALAAVNRALEAGNFPSRKDAEKLRDELRASGH